MTAKTVLAIDPGSREFGFAVFNGTLLTEANVKSLRRTHPKRHRLSVLTGVLNKLIANEAPAIIVLEKNTFNRVPQNRELMYVVRKMKRIASQNDIRVFEFAPNTIKKAITGDALATKRMVASALCALYPQLRVHLGRKYQWQERYYLNMFDAVACGLTYLQFEKTNQVQHYAVEN